MLFAAPPALHAAPAPTPHQLAMKEAKVDRAGRPFIVVAPGDTLTTLGVKFHTKPAALKAWNNLAGEEIEAGKRLYLAPGLQAAVPAEPALKAPSPAAPDAPGVAAALPPVPVAAAAPQLTPGLARAAAQASARPIHEDQGQAFPESKPSVQVQAAARVINEAEGLPIPGTEPASAPTPAPPAVLPLAQPATPVAVLRPMLSPAPAAPMVGTPSAPANPEAFVQEPNGSMVMGAALPPAGPTISTLALHHDSSRRIGRKAAPKLKNDDRPNPLSGVALSPSNPDFRESLPLELPAARAMTDLLAGMPIIDEARPRIEWDATQRAIAAWWEGKVFHTVGALRGVMWSSTAEGPCMDLELGASAQSGAVVVVRVPGNFLPGTVDMTLAREWAREGRTVEVAGYPAYLAGPGTAQAIRAQHLLSPWAILAQIARVRTPQGKWEAITLPILNPQLPAQLPASKKQEAPERQAAVQQDQPQLASAR